MKWKKKIILLSAVVTICLLTACSSYREFEDTMRNKLKGTVSEEEEYLNPAEIPDEDETGEKRLYHMGESDHMGESADSTSIGSSDVMQYTVKRARLVSNIYEEGLSAEDFADPSLVEEDGDVSCMSNECFIVFTVDIHNVNCFGEKCVEWEIGTESGLTAKYGSHGAEACYFSGMPKPEDAGPKDFFFFVLEKGKTQTAEIGWIVPKTYLEEPLYYVISNNGGTVEDHKYILIDEIENRSEIDYEGT